MRESFSLYPNSPIASDAGRGMLKPSLILCCIYLQMKGVISGVQDEVCASLDMAVSRAWSNYGGPL